MFFELFCVIYQLAGNYEGTPVFTDMPSSQPIDIPDAKKRNKKKKRCRATDSFSGRFEGKSFLFPVSLFCCCKELSLD